MHRPNQQLGGEYVVVIMARGGGEDEPPEIVILPSTREFNYGRSGRERLPASIRWIVVTRGLAFTGPGIVLDAPEWEAAWGVPGGAGNDFVLQVSPGPSSAPLGGVVYKYTVHLSWNGTPLDPIDPGIKYDPDF